MPKDKGGGSGQCMPRILAQGTGQGVGAENSPMPHLLRLRSLHGPREGAGHHGRAEVQPAVDGRCGVAGGGGEGGARVQAAAAAARDVPAPGTSAVKRPRRGRSN